MIKFITIILLTIELITHDFKPIYAGNTANNNSIDSSGSVSTTSTEKYRKNNKKWFEFDTNSIIQDSISNLIGGIMFALFLFGFKEYIFKQKNVTGEWNTINKTIKTTYNPYIGLSVEYKIHLLQLGTQISGRGEKLKDLNADGSLYYEYPVKSRVELEIEGHYEKNFLRKSKLYLLIKEKGTARTSSASIELTIPIFKGTELKGKFISTAANSIGTSVWSKIG